MTELYDKAIRFLEDSFCREGIIHTHTIVHLKLTADIVKELRAEADLGLVLAALMHDIDRAFVSHKYERGFKDPIYLKEHQEGCANIAADFLEREGADKELCERVWHLISRHEEGGDEDQNFLRDCDSLSYFRGENYKGMIKKWGHMPDELIEKVNWMYERISSPKIKELVRDKYQEAIEEVNKLT